ncbi:ABC transporter ATP-binding protein [Agromyces larvae]|uniref:ABC transporter ATP-binding protein/permease n=1 Tax=Agromyces larvae TaxID=2929802 RepID=A0ABY4BYW6_9MICO|nr:ABC transporter ATP-binding protein [Agromyces larvae]UOE44314.1 ABC transporter ATP-binding protein/permease [Agromyces larvae]
MSVLPQGAGRFFTAYAIAQGGLALLDGFAVVLLVAVLTPLSGGGVAELPVIGELSGGAIVVTLAVMCLLIVAKSVAAIFLLRWASRRSAHYDAYLAQQLFTAYLRAPWRERLSKHSSEVVSLTGVSVRTTVFQFVLPATQLLGELTTLLAVIIVLAAVQPWAAALALVYMSIVGALLLFWIAKRTRRAGRVVYENQLAEARLITEIIGAFKEIVLRGKTDEVSEVVGRTRRAAATAFAKVQYLSQSPRYVVEAAIIGGFALIGGTALAIGGPDYALFSIAVFGLAGFRLTPSVIRVQSIANSLQYAEPQARRVVDELLVASDRPRPSQPTGVTLPPHPRAIEIDRVGVRFHHKSHAALEEVSLQIPFGSSVAFVGASGAGKSTLVDVILGLIEPDIGTVAIDGVPINRLVDSWGPSIGYVPQDVILFDATVAQNVALTWTDDPDPDRVREALQRAQLLDTIESRPGGLDARIGERGLRLSAGQRQRLGIARALYTSPKVLVLDEATSALDTTTEAAVSEAIRQLAGEVTVIQVAHRLATVMSADLVCFLRDGRLVAQGTFDEVVDAVPDFALQANLAGLR